MKLKQGDLFWISPNGSNGIRSTQSRPHMVVGEDAVGMVVVCALTSNLKRAKEPGNVLLEKGEANLPRQSVVVVSGTVALEKTQLGEFIGTLSNARIKQALAGLHFVQSMLAHHIL